MRLRLDTVSARFSRAIYMAGLTTGQFARLAGLKAHDVMRARSERGPTPEEVEACARVCGVRAAWIAGTVPVAVSLESLPESERPKLLRMPEDDRRALLTDLAAIGYGGG